MLRRSVLFGVVLAAVLVLAIAGTTFAFTDVPSYDPFAEAIEDLSSRGIISGFEDGTFKPDAVVTRQQFAKMIVKSLGLSVSEEDVCNFPDVNPGQAASDPLYPDNYVAVAVAHEITKGYDDGTFRPYVSISRAHVITMVVRALDSLYPKVLMRASDGWGMPYDWASLPPEHANNALTADLNGLLVSLSLDQPMVDMMAPMPRGEVAQILYNAICFVPPDVPFATYSGEGNDVVTIDKPVGPALLYARCDSLDGEFYVQAFDADGSDLMESLSMGYCPYEGVTPLDFGWANGYPAQQTVRLQVTATGPWTLEVRPLSEAPVVGPSETITGTGDAVFRLEEGVATAVIEGGSDEDFLYIETYNLATSWANSPIFALEPYHARVVILSPGYVAVHTMSPWSFIAEPAD